MNKITDIVLIVGTNPLPNYVVTWYYLKKFDSIKRIHLIYSEDNKKSSQSGTKEFANSLEKCLKNNLLLNKSKDIKPDNDLIEFIPHSIKNVSNPESITEGLNNLINYVDKNIFIHLDYTCGTKAMSVHIYNLILNSSASQKTFSYLDARSNKIFVQQNNKTLNIYIDILKNVSINLRDMLDLHCFDIHNNAKETDKYSESIKIISEYIEQNQLFDFIKFSDKLRIEIIEKYDIFSKKHKKNYLKFLQEQNEKSDIIKDFEKYEDFIRSIPNEFSIIKPEVKDKIELKNPESLDKKVFKHTILKSYKFIDGLWLEQYIFNLLNDYFSNKNDNDIKLETNWEFKKQNWSSEINFELDICIINGYQLFGISCTTSYQKNICKGKGFEIIHRARQIGGDESKSILITCMNEDNTEKVSEELKYETGNLKNILVLGIEDLKKDVFLRKFNDFFSIEY